MEKERLFNFLKDDLEKLEKDISVLVDMINTTQKFTMDYSDTQKPLENIDNFFSYWKQHIDKLNKLISDKSDKLDRNTIIITALANYYDYNDLPKEEGREVLKIIMDIQKQNRYERKQR